MSLKPLFLSISLTRSSSEITSRAFCASSACDKREYRRAIVEGDEIIKKKKTYDTLAQMNNKEHKTFLSACNCSVSKSLLKVQMVFAEKQAKSA